MSSVTPVFGMQRSFTGSLLSSRSLRPLISLTVSSGLRVHLPSAQITSLQLPQTRTIHSTPISMSGGFRPPRFNMGPSNGIFSMVPDTLKTGLAVVGGCAFLMVFGPLFFMVMPPLFVGGFFAMRYALRRRSKGMGHRWDLLRESRLKYHGSEMDQEGLENWAKDRVITAFEGDEQNIVKTMGVSATGHDFSSRIVLTGPESIDQDIRVTDRLALSQRITVITYGLVDRDSSRMNKIGTVTVSLQPQNVRDLLDVQGAGTQTAVIEVQPLLSFKEPVIIDTGDAFPHSPILNVRAKRSTRR